MNANANRTPRRRKDVPLSTPFSELPLSGANTEDETGARSAPIDVETNSAAAAGAALAEAGPAPGNSSAAVAEPSKALTVPERAKLLMKSEQTERDLVALVERAQTIVAITNADGRRQAHAVLMELIGARTTLDDFDKTVREDLVAINKGVIEERKRLQAIPAPQEKRLRELRDAWDKVIEDAKRAKAEAEQRRVAAIREMIEDIKGYRDRAEGKSSEDINALITELTAVPINEAFAELKAEAESAQSMTLGKLRYLHGVAVNFETEQKRLAEVREQLAREKAEQDAAAAKDRARIAEEQRVARETAAVEAARVAEENRKAEAARRHREDALDAIRAIQDRVHTAAEGDSLEAYDLALSVTQGERITEERFGDMAETARTAQTNTLATLRQRRAVLEERLANEAALEETRRQQEAEARRLANERAEFERQQEALRVARETVIAPSDPVEATATEDVQPSNLATIVATEKPARPSDAAIVEILMRSFSVERDTILDWLWDMDLTALAHGAPAEQLKAVTA